MMIQYQNCGRLKTSSGNRCYATETDLATTYLVIIVIVIIAIVIIVIVIIAIIVIIVIIRIIIVIIVIVIVVIIFVILSGSDPHLNPVKSRLDIVDQHGLDLIESVETDAAALMILDDIGE